MARLDAQTEYIVTQEAYRRAYDSLPASGTPGQTASSVPVRAKEYRLNVSNTINAGKWAMWSVVEESFAFTWSDGAWRPPANLVIRKD